MEQMVADRYIRAGRWADPEGVSSIGASSSDLAVQHIDAGPGGTEGALGVFG